MQQDWAQCFLDAERVTTGAGGCDVIQRQVAEHRCGATMLTFVFKPAIRLPWLTSHMHKATPLTSCAAQQRTGDSARFS